MDEILEIPAEWEVKADPREALYNDYLDGVRNSYGTLRLIVQLYRDGFLDRKSNTGWWLSFLTKVQNDALHDRNLVR